MRLAVTRPARASACRCVVAVGWATPSLRAMKTTHTPSSVRSPSRCGGKWATGSFSHCSTCSRFWLARAARTALSSKEFPAGDDDRRAAYVHGGDLAARGLHPDQQHGRAADLLALADLDLLAEGDLVVPGQVHAQRTGRRTRRRILGHAEGGREGAELPPRAQARETADPDAGQRAQRSDVGAQAADRLLAVQRHVDVPRTVAVRLDRQPRA